MSIRTTEPPLQGIVIKKTTGQYDVHTAGRTITCVPPKHSQKESAPSGKNSRRGDKKAFRAGADAIETIAIGDVVRFIEVPGRPATIIDVLPRQSRLSRRAVVTGSQLVEQVIVANVDQVVPVFAAARPAPHWNMLDRYLVAAESHNLPSLICITKLDLVQSEGGQIDEEILDAMEEYRRIGYTVHLVCAETGEGIDGLREALHGRTSVMVGKSGVGKTTLLNALQPGLGQKVNAVSEGKLGKGRHTTTHLEMFPLDGGDGAIVDTPGVREFGLWDVDPDEMALFFPEMAPYVGRCRFGLGCAHDDEPGCAVRKAVVAGAISPRRYQSYMRLKQEA